MYNLVIVGKMMRCKACNTRLENIRKREDESFEDLCLYCLGKTNPPDQDHEKPKQVVAQELDSGFTVDWY